jgi:hypothetical protein
MGSAPTGVYMVKKTPGQFFGDGPVHLLGDDPGQLAGY